MGNAGIIRELLRYARIARGVEHGYVAQWPDDPRAGPVSVMSRSPSSW